jgi:hypothetical protein
MSRPLTKNMRELLYHREPPPNPEVEGQSESALAVWMHETVRELMRRGVAADRAWECADLYAKETHYREDGR